jgi:hypothetical protein
MQDTNPPLTPDNGDVTLPKVKAKPEPQPFHMQPLNPEEVKAVIRTDHVIARFKQQEVAYRAREKKRIAENEAKISAVWDEYRAVTKERAKLTLKLKQIAKRAHRMERGRRFRKGGIVEIKRKIRIRVLAVYRRERERHFEEQRKIFNKQLWSSGIPLA